MKTNFVGTNALNFAKIGQKKMLQIQSSFPTLFFSSQTKSKEEKSKKCTSARYAVAFSVLSAIAKERSK
jgi:glutathione peroxidase-family protein